MLFVHQQEKHENKLLNHCKEISNMKQVYDSPANHWFLKFENSTDKEIYRPFGFYNALLFLSDSDYCQDCLLKLHGVIFSWYKAIESAESNVMMFLNHHNTLKSNNNLTKRIDSSMTRFIKREVHNAVKDIHLKLLNASILSYLSFWMCCLWEDSCYLNDVLTIKFMYLSDHEYELPVSCGDVMNWIYMIFGLTEELYLLPNRNIQLLFEWTLILQLCNLSVQILEHFSAVIEFTLGKMIK